MTNALHLARAVMLLQQDTAAMTNTPILTPQDGLTLTAIPHGQLLLEQMSALVAGWICRLATQLEKDAEQQEAMPVMKINILITAAAETTQENSIKQGTYTQLFLGL
jgi:hypothetical protein